MDMFKLEISRKKIKGQFVFAISVVEEENSSMHLGRYSSLQSCFDYLEKKGVDTISRFREDYLEQKKEMKKFGIKFQEKKFGIKFQEKKNENRSSKIR